MQRTLWLTGAGYCAMVGATVALFLLIRSHGETLAAGTLVDSSPQPSSTAARGDTLLRVLIALVAVIVAGQLLGAILKRLGQPAVLGEVIAGILLGPSLLGVETAQCILPAEAAPFVGIIAQLGVILYLFVVGLELDPARLRQRLSQTLLISHAGIVAPFLLGAFLAIFLYPRLSSADVPFTSFALFLGVAMAITAFPVLARILDERRLSRTSLGVTALTCAALGDATAWCLLAFVVGVARAQVDHSLLVAAGMLGYIAFMLLIVRPVLARVLPRGEGAPVSRATLGAVFVLLLLSAVATEAIGIHALFGAFLFGAIIPHDSAVARTLGRQLEDVVLLLLLPAFFAFTGMRTRLDLITGGEAWLICGLIVLVATLGKFGGSVAAARLTGMGWRNAAALGTLMNTRGLMELIVLNVGLELKVISPELFSMLVIMALVTTLATSPLLQLLTKPGEGVRQD